LKPKNTLILSSPMINEIFEDEILNQPDDMKTTIDFIRSRYESIEFKRDKINRLIFVGSGDSYIAPHSLLLLIYKYINAHILILTPSEVYNYNYDENDLIVLISFSGESKQLLRAKTFIKNFNCEVFSITYNSNNPISSGCNYKYKIPIKSNRLTPNAPDYMNTLLAIALFIEKYVGRKLTVLDDLPIKVREQIQLSYPSVKKACNEIYKSRNYFFIGSGQSYGSCKYASAKLWETGGIQSIDCRLDEFPHGMHLMANNEDSIFIISSNKEVNNTVDEVAIVLQNIVKNVYVITNSLDIKHSNHLLINKISEYWHPFLETIILQLICLFISNNNKYDVIKKNGINANFEKYNKVHNLLVR